MLSWSPFLGCTITERNNLGYENIFCNEPIILVMLITSMGIFGFLSRLHIESNIIVGANSVQVKQIEQRENLLRERLTYLYRQAGDDPEKVARTTDRQIRAHN